MKLKNVLLLSPDSLLWDIYGEDAADFYRADIMIFLARYYTCLRRLCNRSMSKDRKRKYRNLYQYYEVQGMCKIMKHYKKLMPLSEIKRIYMEASNAFIKQANECQVLLYRELRED